MKNDLTLYTTQTPEVEKLVIETTDDLTQATSLLSQLNRQLDAIKAHKEEKTKPLNTALRAIRDDYRPYEEALNDAIASLKTKMNTYATRLAIEQKEQQDKILSDKRTSTETKINKLATLDDKPTEATTEQGSVKFYTVKKWRVVDMTKVPLDYLVVNEDAVKQAIKEDTPVPGIEFYEEQALRNYRS